MFETRLISFNVGVDEIVPSRGNITLPAFPMHGQDVVGLIGEDWEPVSHTILPLGETLLVSFLVRREVRNLDDLQVPADW